ncbi:MAG TPA: septum formation initiator family protein [Candidatus Limnocylindrales bacterium]|nr:septum formation initiator family protein [Candidatus Limnocylindrales bacterium]
MSDRTTSPPLDSRRPSPGSDDDPEPAEAAADGPETADRVDLSSLSIAGISRRHVAWLAAALISAWIVVIFARQVGDASAAASRATQLVADNAALAAEVQALEHEVAFIVRPEYVAQQARAYRFGGPREIPFTLDPSVAAPVDGAPGSASVRLGARDNRQTPLESWLSLLFGPGN